MTHSIEIKELNKLLSSGDSVALLDVRRRTDYAATPQKIAGAIWRAPEKIDAWISQLPVGNRTVVYCVKGGSVSQTVSERLCRESLDDRFLEGGLSAEEAVELDLPVKDYTLWSPEERIIIQADRLVDIITDGIVAVREEREAEERFEEILRTTPKF